MEITLPPTRNIGEHPDGASKFAAWAGTSGYYRRPETLSNPYKSDKMISGCYTTEELKTNVSLCHTMAHSNKSKVVDNRKATGLKATEFTRSQAMDAFQDQRDWSRKLLAEDQSSFEQSFREYAIEENTDFSMTVWTRNVAKVVKLNLGSSVPEFIHDRFSVLSRKYADEGRISWISFSNDVIPKVQSAVQSECQFRRELPALLKLMNRPRIIDPDIGPLGDMSTNYRDFFNKPQPMSFTESAKLTFRKINELEGSSLVELNAASKALNAGTIKGTLQIPGYLGHVPKNVSNLRKFDHSVGKIVHPVDNNLRLTQRGMGAVLGYTGHIPHVIEGGNTERITGMDPRTSNGAAYGPVRLGLAP